MKLLKQLFSHGWVEACANGQVGCMGGFIDVVGMGGWVGLQKLITFLGGWVGAEMVSSIVMYNFGGGPRGDPLFTAF